MKSVLKSSFTLFELLIVLLIISLIYAIFIQKISSSQSPLKDKLFKIDNFLKNYDFNKSADIICIDRCLKCFLEIDGKKKKEIELFNSEVKVYDFNIHGIFSQIKFPPYFDKNGNPNNVCFRYTIYSNQSHSSYIVEYNDKFYVFYAYMQPPKIATDISSAQKLFDLSDWIPTDSTQYNF